MSPDLAAALAELERQGASLADADYAHVVLNDAYRVNIHQVGALRGFRVASLPDREQAVRLSHDLNKLIDATTNLLKP